MTIVKTHLLIDYLVLYNSTCKSQCIYIYVSKLYYYVFIYILYS